MGSYLQSAINSATTAVDTVKNTLSSSGPAAALGAAVSGVAGAVSGALSSLGGLNIDIGNIFSSLTSGVAQSDAKLPMPNVLNNYASYNYVFSLSCLDAQSFNFPNDSYVAGKYSTFILKSANASPDSRISTVAGKFDFYIDNLTLVGQYGFEKDTGNTNSSNLEFTVIEPYSMGFFMMACQKAAKDAGYNSYTEAKYLLTIEFKGIDQAGNPKTVPGTTKWFPFTMNNMTFKVTGAGSVYSVIGVPANAEAMTDSYKILPSDVAITGKTVQEILQTGENSLQAIANARFKQMKEDKLVAVPDEIVILFPTDISSKAGAGSYQSKPESTDGATTASSGSISDSKLFQKLGVQRGGAQNLLQQGTGDCNSLGKASLGFDASRPGEKPMTNSIAFYDEAKGTFVRGKNIAPPGQAVFTFGQNSDIINIINQVLIKSDASKQALDPKQITKEGMRPWWRIDTQVYHVASNANDKYTGQVPKLIVYRVVPYQVHASRLLPPNAPAPGVEELKKQCAKVYNYIYTGKNTDLLRFEIDISQTYYNPTLADAGKRSGDSKTADSEAGASDGEDSPAPKIPLGNTPSQYAQPTRTRPTATSTSTDNLGGTKGETEENRIARMFHDSLISGQDMMNINFDIIGDPYYIANSGSGNFTDNPTQLINVTKDGNVNYQTGEVDVLINFRTPTDINQTSGLYNLKDTKLIQQFSGLYKLTTITSTFSKGQFKQNLKAMRRPGQDSTVAPNPAQLISAATVAPGTNAPTEIVPDGSTQTFDDGSSIQTFDDGSTLVTDSDGNVSSTPSKD
jgi:hypothetical protein